MDTYTLGAASKFLGRSLEDVMRLVESGQLACTQAPDGEVFISGQSLVRFEVATFDKSA